MRRAISFLVFLVSGLLFASNAAAQSKPQPVRDYIYGPGGKLVTTVEPDNFAPFAPSSLSATVLSCRLGISLSWSATTDLGSGVAGYKIYRDENGGNYTYLGSTTGTSYTNKPPDAQEDYDYYVFPYDKVGNVGAASTVEIYWEGCISLLVRNLIPPNRREGLFGSLQNPPHVKLFDIWRPQNDFRANLFRRAKFGPLSLAPVKSSATFVKRPFLSIGGGR